MRRAEPKHHKLIIETLAKAFDGNASVNYVVKQGTSREQRIRGLMKYSLSICTAFGEVWLSDDEKACALILLPDKKKTTFQSILWDLELSLSVIGFGRVATILKREAIIKANHPKGKFCYLWFIGVDPENQGKGIGSTLLKSVIERFDQVDRPIYLETSVETNLTWYKKFGFVIFNEVLFSSKLYLLRRPANR
jgi:ribosomal protein S18 acetylase RimI-like enzyme